MSETAPLFARRESQAGNRGAVSFRLTAVRSIIRPEFELFCGLVWSFPKLIGSIVVLSMFSGNSYHCDVPIVEWAIIEVVSCAMDIALSLLFLVYSPGRLPYSKHAYSWVRIFNFVWWVFGVAWVLTAQTCGKTAPEMYWLAVTLVAMDFLAFFKSCLMLAAMLPLVFCYLPWILTLMPQGDLGASRALIEALPRQRYSPNMLDDKQAECIICRNKYEAGIEVRILACHPKHIFHQTCIDSWLKQNASCPICRKLVFATDEEDEWNDGVE
eukprot:gb/GEZN01012603.1/.p1 GENE.gb/GEZN01012603.1/~~gb/GEZN01012603.1/.p1  ORF type:complete len:270 (-),score=13.88 gb/GEZN01012603.1/:222-1031(-)